MADGECLIMHHDQALKVGSCDQAEVVIWGADENTDAEALRDQVLAEAEQIFEAYYRSHTLTREGFNRQAEKLLELHGAASFTAAPGEQSAYSLFVQGGEVLAVAAGEPRHPYGAYCELMVPLAEPQAAQRAKFWLIQGEAHDRYMCCRVPM